LPNRIARQYTYVYGAVSPVDGKSDFLILPSMRKQAFDCFLGELSNWYPNEHIALIVDGAASHRTDSITVPENITLIALPPYSPQLNPIENLWKVMRARFFPNLDFDCMGRLEENLCDALNHLEQTPELIRSVTGYQWILNVLSV
jgi:transposase